MRVLAIEAGVRGLACVTTELAREGARRHSAYPIAAAALAYGLTGGALLGGLLKVQERVALKIEADGRLRKMVIEADAYGRVRGYIAVPDAASVGSADRAAVSAAIGHEGILTVVKDLRIKDLYRSVVPLATGEIDRELESYLNRSEQIPSLVEIGVHTDETGELAAVGGLLIQALPGRGRDTISRLGESFGSQPPLETLLADGLTPRQILDRALGGIAYDVLEEGPVEFHCTCSREQSRQALKLLAAEDILALLAEGEAIVDCHFCYARYHFDDEELEAILGEIQAAE
jgi:molecular chaperone Hsp33